MSDEPDLASLAAELDTLRNVVQAQDELIRSNSESVKSKQAEYKPFVILPSVGGQNALRSPVSQVSVSG